MLCEPLNIEQFKKLHKDLITYSFACLYGNDPALLFNDYLVKFDSLRYIRKDTMLPEMEIKFARDSLDLQQIKNRIKLPLTKLQVFFSTIESNIAFKEEYLTSEKDMEDAKHLRLIYEGKINEKEIERIKKEIRRLKL